MGTISKGKDLIRALKQRWGTTAQKRALWNNEFASGHWKCLTDTGDDFIYRVLDEYTKNGRILDLGCGSGNTGNELSISSYSDYVGVDISDVAVEQATNRSKLNGRGERNRYIVADVASYEPEGAFNVILFRETLYYLPNSRIKSVLNHYAAYLTPAGVFVVRLWSARRYQSIISLIETEFPLIEMRRDEKSEAVALVFR